MLTEKKRLPGNLAYVVRACMHGLCAEVDIDVVAPGACDHSCQRVFDTERAELAGGSCTMVDASEIVQMRLRDASAKLALRLRENELSVIYDNVRELVFRLAVEGEGCFRILPVNRAFYEATRQIIGGRVQQVIPKPSCAVVLKQKRDALATRAAVKREESTD